MKLESKEKMVTVIELMREELVLWNVHSVNYHKRARKQTALVAEELGVDGKQDGTTLGFNIQKN